jgi:hypothetical protein
MDHKEVAAMIREVRRRIPLGGSVRIQGSPPISGAILNEWAARLVEKAAVHRHEEMYEMMCDEPATKDKKKCAFCRGEQEIIGEI